MPLLKPHLLTTYCCVLFCVVQSISTLYVASKEYCSSEAFEAECPESHVITIQHAVYGRMRSGRCITDEYKTGCQADVTSSLANSCAGRSHCQVLVGTMEVIAQPCEKDLRSYLEAAYTCIHVKYAKPCHQINRNVVLTQSQGYLAPYSPTPYTLDLGSLCPWEVRGQPGQRVNISLVNLFTVTSHDQSDYPSSCPMTVIIREENMRPKTFDLCDMNAPVLLHTSKSHVLYVDIHSKYTEVIQKLLKYEVYGCPNIEPSKGAYIRRDGDNIAIVCNASAATWYLTCKDGHWVGQPGNCTPEVKSPKHTQPSGGITLAIIVGVALGTFMGACLLCIVYLIRKRKRRTRNATYTTELQYEPGMRSSDVMSSTQVTTQIGSQPYPAVMCQAKCREPGEITEYTHVWNMHPPSICTERQYSSSTFNPNYDHSRVPLQNYDSNTMPSPNNNNSGGGGASSGGGGGKMSLNNSCSKNNNDGISSATLRSASLQEDTALNNTRTHFCELHGNV